MQIVCGHCGAAPANLHTSSESAGILGRFRVIKCRLCGWEASRLVPRKSRPLPSEIEAILQEEKSLNARFANFAHSMEVGASPYVTPSFQKEHPVGKFKEGFNTVI